MHFCRFWFSNMVSFRYVLVLLNFFVFALWVTKYFLILLNFTRYLLFANTFFFIDEKRTQWMLGTKVKVLYVSWNHPETVFHEMPWKKNFTVYPSLNNAHVCLKIGDIVLLKDIHTLHKKWSFPLRISSVNVTKSAGICGFSHIYWRNP